MPGATGIRMDQLPEAHRWYETLSIQFHIPSSEHLPRRTSALALRPEVAFGGLDSDVLDDISGDVAEAELEAVWVEEPVVMTEKVELNEPVGLDESVAFAAGVGFTESNDVEEDVTMTGALEILAELATLEPEVKLDSFAAGFEEL